MLLITNFNFNKVVIPSKSRNRSGRQLTRILGCQGKENVAVVERHSGRPGISWAYEEVVRTWSEGETINISLREKRKGGKITADVFLLQS